MNKIVEMAKLKKGAEYVGNGIKNGAEFIGQQIKENTELAEHETGVLDVKKDAKSVFNKIKEVLQKQQSMGSHIPINPVLMNMSEFLLTLYNIQ